MIHFVYHHTKSHDQPVQRLAFSIRSVGNGCRRLASSAISCSATIILICEEQRVTPAQYLTGVRSKSCVGRVLGRTLVTTASICRDESLCDCY